MRFVGNGGRALVCLHGLGGSSHDLEPLLPITHTSVLFDYPGHGVNFFDFPNFTVSRAIEETQRVLDHVSRGFDKIDVLAFSIGGFVALNLALEFDFSHLYLIAPLSDFKGVFSDIDLDSWKANDYFEYKGSLVNLKYSFYEDGLQYDHDFSKIQAPVRILHGIYDDVVPISQSERLASTLRNAELKKFPCGHTDILSYISVSDIFG